MTTDAPYLKLIQTDSKLTLIPGTKVTTGTIIFPPVIAIPDVFVWQLTEIIFMFFEWGIWHAKRPEPLGLDDYEWIHIGPLQFLYTARKV